MGKGPSSMNLVSLLLVLVAAAGGYAVWKFTPVYWTAWQVDHLLADGGARAYRIEQVKEPQRSTEREKLVAEIRQKIVQQYGIRDPEMTVNLEVEGTDAIIRCNYREVVFHPVGNKFTVMNMHRMAKVDLKKPQWE